MRRASLAATMMTAVVVAANVFTQSVPNFAGKWTLVPDANAPAGGGRGGFGGLGQSATISQDATTLTITRSTQVGEFTSIYKLDGSESKNTLNMQGNAIQQISKARWEGPKLIVNTSMNFNGNPVEVTMTMLLDPEGNLIVESTRPDFQGGSAPITTKTTYKKN
jgi:hypothetical protein